MVSLFVNGCSYSQSYWVPVQKAFTCAFKLIYTPEIFHQQFHGFRSQMRSFIHLHWVFAKFHFLRVKIQFS